MTRFLLITVLIVLAVGAVLVAAQVVIDLRRGCPRRTPLGLLLWSAFRVYARLVHRARCAGLDHLASLGDGPVVVVSNHTGGADPLLIQACCRREIRWMMMREMNTGIARWFTRVGRIILVERDGTDLASTREALRHLKEGGVIGIFPEGGIERPPEVLRKFHSGVGLLATRGGAAVAPVWVSGTPKVDVAFNALLRPSRARVAFGPVMRFDRKADAAEVTRAIRDQIAAMSGWPSSDADADDPIDADRVQPISPA